MLLWVGAQMHTSSWSVLASLFLAFVLWSRQGRGSRKLLEFMMRISPFQHPNQNGWDEEEASSQEEGEPLHEVKCGWVERVEDAGGCQHGQAIHTGHSRKEGTLL